MRLLREPSYRIWPSPRLLQRAIHQWTFTKGGTPRSSKVVANIWDLFKDKIDIQPHQGALSTLTRVLRQDPTAIKHALRIATRHAPVLTTDHYAQLYRHALYAKDVAALLTIVEFREQHLTDKSQLIANMGLLKLEVQARLACGDELFASAVEQLDGLPDDATRARLLRALLVDAALTPGLAPQILRLWGASTTRNSTSEALLPIASILAQLDGAQDQASSLHTSPFLQPSISRLAEKLAKKATKQQQQKSEEKETAEAPAAAT